MTETTWERRLRTERLLAARVARVDRSRGAAVLQRHAGPELARWLVGEGDLRALGIRTDGFADSWWLAPDGDAVYSLHDPSGAECGHVRRTDMDDPRKWIDLTPDLPPYGLRGGDASPDGRTVAMVAVTGSGFELLALDLGRAGAPRRLYRTPHEMWNPRLSADGTLVAVNTTDHNPGVRRWAVTVFDVATGRTVGQLVEPGSSVTGVAFSALPADPRLLVEVCRGPAGLARPALWNPHTPRLDEIAIEAADSELIGLDWSDDALQLLVVQHRLGTQTLLLHEPATRQTRPLPLPPGSYWLPLVYQSGFGPSGTVLAVRETAATPLQVLQCTPDRRMTVLSSPSVPPGTSFTSAAFASADGTQIQGWLATPAGAGPFPAVVHLHGGPHWHVSDQFSPAAQAWVEQGYAYLALNYRGSTGRGSRFAEQIWGDVGRRELEDLAAARHWLVEQGTADPSAMFVIGESYGGFLTLYAMGRQPHLWAGGIAEVAVADWGLTWQQCSTALRAAIESWFGGDPHAREELYRRRSPITYAARVRAPVLVMQGCHDSRAPAGQMLRYEQRMRQLGKTIRVDWFDGGHELPGADGELARVAASIAFADAIRPA